MSSNIVLSLPDGQEVKGKDAVTNLDPELANLGVDDDVVEGDMPPPVVTGSRFEFQPRERAKVPLQPGFGLYDWMKIVSAGGDLSGLPGGNKGGMKRFTLEEVRQHCTEDDAWMVLRGVVYNVTAYMKFHPGGIEQLLRGVGRDCTALFDEVHSWVNIEGFLKTCRVGLLADAPGIGGGGLGVGGASGGGTGWTTPVRPKKASVRSITIAAPDSKVITVVMEDGEAPFTLAEGQHINVRANIRGKLHNRPYTPISDPALLKADKPTMELLVKVYQDGAVSQYLNKLKVGDVMQFTIPAAPFQMPPPAVLKRMGLIAGGTGIAPMIPILRRLVQDSAYANVECSVLSSNFTEKDILCRQLLDDLVSKAGGSRIKVHHALTRIPEGEQVPEGLHRGRVDEQKIRDLMPAPDATTAIVVCGPIVMTNATAAILGKVGYAEENVFVFI